MRSATAPGSDTAALCGVTVTRGWRQSGEFDCQRLLFEHVERHGVQRAVIEAAQDVGLDLQPAATGVDQHRPAQIAVPGQLPEQPGVENPCGVRGERQQHHQDLRMGQEPIQALLARKRLDAILGLRRAAPSRDVESQNFQLAGRVAAQHPEAHHADPDIAGGGLAQIVVPDAPPLLILVARLLAVMRQNVQHHPFAHPASQVRVDHAGDRYGRQVRVGQQMVDPSAKREDGLQPREAGESARGMPPSSHEAHACRIRNLVPAKARSNPAAAPERRRPRAGRRSRRPPWRRQNFARPFSFDPIRS